MNGYKNPDIYRKYMSIMMISTMFFSVSSLIISAKNSSAIESSKTIIVCKAIEKAYKKKFVICEDSKNV